MLPSYKLMYAFAEPCVFFKSTRDMTPHHGNKGHCFMAATLTNTYFGTQIKSNHICSEY